MGREVCKLEGRKEKEGEERERWMEREEEEEMGRNGMQWLVLLSGWVFRAGVGGEDTGRQ